VFQYLGATVLLVHERKGRRSRPGSPGIGLGPGSRVFNINQPDISYVKTTGQLDVSITPLHFLQNIAADGRVVVNDLNNHPQLLVLLKWAFVFGEESGSHPG